MKTTNSNQDPHYREYRERCQAGQKTEDDEEIYESHDEVSHDEELYDEGYKGALKDFARAFGFSDVIPPMDSDTLLGHARQLTKYRQGYESIQHERDHARACEKKAVDRQAVLAMERDEARAAYEAETLSAAEMVKVCAAITGHAPPELCTTSECVEWLVARHRAAANALHKLEEIRTEKLAAKGLTEEASAVSLARVILSQNAEASHPTRDR